MQPNLLDTTTLTCIYSERTTVQDPDEGEHDSSVVTVVWKAPGLDTYGKVYVLQHQEWALAYDGEGARSVNYRNADHRVFAASSPAEAQRRAVATHDAAVARCRAALGKRA